MDLSDEEGAFGTTFRDALKEQQALLSRMQADEAFVRNFSAIGAVLAQCVRKGGTLYIAGNGGSAADAQHFAAELVGRYLRDRPPIRAVALTTDTSMLTAWANDVGYDTVFSRQLEAHGTERDAFIGISTSGGSKNLLAAFQTGRARGMVTVGLLGRDGGQAASLVDHALIVPSAATPRIQEGHILIIHAWCEVIERVCVPEAP